MYVSLQFVDFFWSNTAKASNKWMEKFNFKIIISPIFTFIRIETTGELIWKIYSKSNWFLPFTIGKFLPSSSTFLTWVRGKEREVGWFLSIFFCKILWFCKNTNWKEKSNNLIMFFETFRIEFYVRSENVQIPVIKSIEKHNDWGFFFLKHKYVTW